jgi:hypothetical protein
MSNNSFKVKNSTVLTPKDLSTLTNPEAGELACDINDNNKIKKYDVLTSSWSEVGSGASSLDTVFQLIGDDVPNWSKGNNASFLGGGSLAGTFAAESTTPLNGPQSYKYTQAAGSLNDYIASPIKSVSSRFRGRECTLYFPFDYNGNSNDIRVVFYDVTNSQEIPSSVYLQSSPTVSIFKTNIVIPSTCANIRVGFQVAVVNSGKILEFDDVVLSNDTTVYADIANQNQSAGYPTSSSTITIASPSYSSGSGLFSVSSSQITVLRSCKISITSSISLSTTDLVVTLARNGNTIAYDRARIATTNSLYASASATVDATPGDIFTFTATASAVGNLLISATASNSNILTAPETFSTDTSPLTYAGSGTVSGLAGLASASVGTFITFTTAINTTSTHTQTTTAPTQTTSDMNNNGILLYTRAYNAASTAAQPAYVAIQIGKGMKGVSVNGYTSTAKSGNYIKPDQQAVSGSTEQIGAFVGYNEVTGVLILNAATTWGSTFTGRYWIDNAGNARTSGYLVINASKNPALTGIGLPARVYSESAGNAGQVITANVTNIPFIGISDTHGAWNGSQYVVPETGIYSLSGSIYFTTSAARSFDLYIDGVSVKRVTDTTTSSYHDLEHTTKLNKGQVISIRSLTGGTLNTSAMVHYLNITKVSN